MAMQRSFQLPYPLIPYPARSIHPAGSPAAQPPRQPNAFGGDGGREVKGELFQRLCHSTRLFYFSNILKYMFFPYFFHWWAL